MFGEPAAHRSHGGQFGCRVVDLVRRGFQSETCVRCSQLGEQPGGPSGPRVAEPGSLADDAHLAFDAGLEELLVKTAQVIDVGVAELAEHLADLGCVRVVVQPELLEHRDRIGSDAQVLRRRGCESGAEDAVHPLAEPERRLGHSG